jgi:hypothetical protein
MTGGSATTSMTQLNVLPDRQEELRGGDRDQVRAEPPPAGQPLEGPRLFGAVP